MPSQEGFEFLGMATHYHSTQSTFKNINIPRLDQLIDEVSATADPAQRKQKMLESVVLAKTDYSTFAVLAPFVVLATGPKVGEVPQYRSSRLVGNQLATLTHTK
ncbi:MAG: hypothetical protein Q7O66_14870, partial [Dehalococcoidia bacterium]|nr:hypothetical protein [Dehalococcoidia bacterium]